MAHRTLTPAALLVGVLTASALATGGHLSPALAAPPADPPVDTPGDTSPPDPARTVIVSGTDRDHAAGNDLQSWPSISHDGRRNTFVTDIPQAAADTNTSPDVYVRDLPNDTVSLVSDPERAVDTSYRNAISGDGRFVAFTQDSGESPYADEAVVRDLATGQLTVASVTTDGTPSGSAGQDGPSCSADDISATGRFVVMQCNGSLDPSRPDLRLDVWVRDLQDDTTTLVSQATSGRAAATSSRSGDATISNDGSRVAFTSTSNLDPSMGRVKPHEGLYVRDLEAGTTKLVSLNNQGVPADQAPYFPEISGNGHDVVFEDTADSLRTGDGSLGEVYVRDVDRGVTSAITVHCLTRFCFQYEPAISDSGRFVTYQLEDDYGPGPGYRGHVFVTDRSTATTTDVGVANPDRAVFSEDPAISGNGRDIAFESGDPAFGSSPAGQVQSAEQMLVRRRWSNPPLPTP